MLQRPVRRIWYFIRHSRREADLAEEFEFHHAMKQRDFEERGVDPAHAALAARRELGNVAIAREDARALWIWPWLDSAWQDGAYAVRHLRRHLGFASVAILVLAAVTGLNTSLFTVFTALTVHAPSGITDPARVVSLYPAVRLGDPDLFSVAEYRFLADRATLLRAAAISGGGTVPLGVKGAAGTARALLVSGNLFDTLGIAVIRGRSVHPDDDRQEAPQAVVVLGERLWESRFGGDPEIVGRSLLLNDVPFTVVGIASRDFVGLEPAIEGLPGLFLPIAAFPRLRPDSAAKSASMGSAIIVGRLVPGATRERARGEADGLLRAFDTGQGVEARPLIVTSTAFLSHPGRSVILVMLGLISIALMLVWLLACANVGNLQLARAVARAQEIRIRLSLGASRGRVVRQLLTEGFVLALLACALGVYVAYTLPPLLLRIVGDQTAMDALNFSLAPDGAVLGYAVLLAALSSLAFGLAPALYVTRSDPSGVPTGQDATSPSRFPLRGVLLGVQVAVSVILLVGAGLLVRRIQRQASTDPGFRVDEVSLVSFSPPGEEYFAANRGNAFVADLTESLRRSSFGGFGFSSQRPFEGGGRPTDVRLPGETPAQARRISSQDISPGYLEVLRIPIVAGRGFEPADTARRVALVNESMAHQLWPNETPIGKTFVAGQSETREIVGVVRNVSNGFEEVRALYYWPLGQSAGVSAIEMRGGRRATVGGGPLPQLVVQGSGAAVSGQIATLVARLDRRVRTQTTPLAASFEEQRKAMRVGPILAGLLGLFALVLATVGTFGVFSYVVRQRTREIGIRMALGAQPADVVRLILTGHSHAVLAGLFVGLVGSVAAAQVMRRFAYGLSPFDPVAYLGVAAILTLAGLTASYIPARRATRTDPIAALRCD